MGAFETLLHLASNVLFESMIQSMYQTARVVIETFRWLAARGR